MVCGYLPVGDTRDRDVFFGEVLDGKGEKEWKMEEMEG